MKKTKIIITASLLSALALTFVAPIASNNVALANWGHWNNFGWNNWNNNNCWWNGWNWVCGWNNWRVRGWNNGWNNGWWNGWWW